MQADDDDDILPLTTQRLSVNKAYAARFEETQRKKELQKLRYTLGRSVNVTTPTYRTICVMYIWMGGCILLLWGFQFRFPTVFGDLVMVHVGMGWQ